MAAGQVKLDVMVDTASFWFCAPPGQPVDLSKCFGQRLQAVQALLGQRYPLSEALQKRVKALEHNRSRKGLLCQLCFGLFLPSGILLQGEWDYDRDMDLLQREVSVVLSAHLPPTDYELQEHIDSETAFKSGKVLFTLYLT